MEARDVVVTVPKAQWTDWLAEGDLPGTPWRGYESHFWVSNLPLNVSWGSRVYVVAHGRLRGYAYLETVEDPCRLDPTKKCLLRRGDAEAMTIPVPVRGFQGWRYRWWDRADEVPFPNWITEDVS